MSLLRPIILTLVRARDGAPRRPWESALALVLIVAGAISGFATYAALRDMPPFGNDPDSLVWLIHLDLAILLSLLVLIAWRVRDVWRGRKKGVAGSRLYVRLVLIFSLLAAVPAIIMTFFAAYFFHFGVQTWFSERVRTAVEDSHIVAQAYLKEHQQVIRADILAMANDLDRQSALLMGNPQTFESIVRTQSLLRNFSEAIVFERGGKVLAASGLSFVLEFEQIPEPLMEQAQERDVVLVEDDNDNRVRALVRLNNFSDSYLYVGRTVDPRVLAHVSATRRASQDYARLEQHFSGLQRSVTLIFGVVGLVLLLAAIWMGLQLARQLVTPIGEMISTADKVREGDLTARVPRMKTIEEFDYLASAFNRMTRQIQEQRDELVSANHMLDSRRRFTEAVLAGVSSGVLGVDSHGKITLANASAALLLGMESTELTQRNVGDLMPGLDDLLAQAYLKPGRTAQTERVHQGKDGHRRIFLVRIGIDSVGLDKRGAVITFDDITALQSAQRKAAWADVARRIAHEIKNPLTPIQLSADRLRRKYLKEIQTDPEIFAQCTDTIIRHVEDIGRMVNEFSAFARMPEPVIRPETLAPHIRDMLVLQKQAHPDIAFDFQSQNAECESLPVPCDAQQIRQALTNLLQNAIDSIRAVGVPLSPLAGHITITLGTQGDHAVIAVRDDGPGLPSGVDPAHITEPYVTHKEKGTGLGLAIVKKIMEDHGGALVIGAPETGEGDTPRRGAVFSLVLPLAQGGEIDKNGTPDGERHAQAA